MRIKEFSIRQYGPLPDTGRVPLSNFNLFFGKNEDGKTLLIDALVKRLFGQNRWVFERVDRVDGDPDGYVIMEDDKGNKIKLPEKGDLTKIAGLKPSDCRNVFIIRNSDLSIARESQFYTDVTGRLTGLRTKEISSIKEKLQEIGRITRADSSGSLSDMSKWGKIKTKVENAKKLIKKIIELKKEIKVQNFDQMEEEASKAAEKVSEIEQKINDMDTARKRALYEKGEELLKKLKVSLKNLQGLNLEEIKKLKSRLDGYEENREKLSSQEPKRKFLAKAMMISAVLSLASIFGVIIRPIPFLFYLTALFIVSTVILGVFEFLLVMKKVQLATAFKEIKMSATQLGVGGESIKDVYLNIQKVDGNLKSKEEAEIRLDSHFRKRSKNLEENLSHWGHEIDALKEYKDKAINVEYDEKIVSQLKEEMKSLSDKKEQMQKRMKDFKGKLEDVERKANEILQLEEEYLHCDTSVDSNAIRERLKDFIDRIESNRDNVLEVIKLFEGIEKEEEEKVSHLFGKDSPISKYFYEITGGIYQHVKYTPDEKKIEVKPKNRKSLDAKKLSGGAYDQLYLSIRLALGEKLLKGNKGFFIMDDPFIKADIERLQKQIDILKRISESGWQILYFTAKDEVKEILKEDIESDKVNYVEIPGVFS